MNGLFGSIDFDGMPIALSSAPTKLSVGDKAWRSFYKGKHYPHSSTRQRARYARQIAAGQLNIGRVEPVAVTAPVKVKKPRVRKTVGSVVE